MWLFILGGVYTIFLSVSFFIAGWKLRGKSNPRQKSLNSMINNGKNTETVSSTPLQKPQGEALKSMTPLERRRDENKDLLERVDHLLS